jgi:hypothetical protein
LKENQKKSYEFAKDIIYENVIKGRCCMFGLNESTQYIS